MNIIQQKKTVFYVEFRAKSRRETPHAGQTNYFYSPASQTINNYFPDWILGYYR